VTKAYLLEDGKDSKLSDNGVETDVDLLAIGDFIKVSNGSIVPIDGMVVLGNGLCNESMLTGESKPVQKSVGVKIYGGTIFTMGSVIVRVDKLNEQSTINQIMKLVENT
jgi:Cu+-exporting ATPase